MVAHTGLDGELPAEKISAGSALQLPGRTVVVLQVDCLQVDRRPPWDELTTMNRRTRVLVEMVSGGCPAPIRRLPAIWREYVASCHAANRPDWCWAGSPRR